MGLGQLLIVEHSYTTDMKGYEKKQKQQNLPNINCMINICFLATWDAWLSRNWGEWLQTDLKIHIWQQFKKTKYINLKNTSLIPRQQRQLRGIFYHLTLRY
jgi:hypothetical protein